MRAERRLEALLTYTVSEKASDLHVHAASPIKLRRNGTLTDLDAEPVTREVSEAILREILTPEQQRDLDEHGQIDFAYTIPGVGRFRGNAYRQQRGIDTVFRAIPPDPPTLEDLGLPATLARYLASGGALEEAGASAVCYDEAEAATALAVVLRAHLKASGATAAPRPENRAP